MVSPHFTDAETEGKELSNLMQSVVKSRLESEVPIS